MAFPNETKVKVSIDFGSARQEALALAAMLKGCERKIEDLEKRADALDKRAKGK